MEPDKGSREILVKVQNLRKHFPVPRGIFSKTIDIVRAVDGVDFQIPKGKALGFVGESGCGKTTIARSILRLIEPTSGTILFDGIDLLGLDQKHLRTFRRQMQMIFQDPFMSLNPRMKIEDIISEPLRIHAIAIKPERMTIVKDLLELVGVGARFATRYPHEFSGGQRQRIGIARALALKPQLIVCDEPVSALDVSIQSEIINLLIDLQMKFGLTYFFISHNLNVVRHICDEVAVMYLGKIIEYGPQDVVFEKPIHPYTKALLSAVPEPIPGSRKGRIILEGDIPSPFNPPNGCRFHTRCWLNKAICREIEPALLSITEKHKVRCHFGIYPL